MRNLATRAADALSTTVAVVALFGLLIAAATARPADPYTRRRARRCNCGPLRAICPDCEGGE